MNHFHGTNAASYITVIALLVTVACDTDEGLSSESHALEPAEIPIELSSASRRSTPPPGTETPSDSIETGTTFFVADGESGTMNPWSQPWGIFSNFSNPVPVNSTARSKNGARSFKYETTNPVAGASSQTLAGNPQMSMGSPNGRFLSGYYSFWAYVDAGYTGTNWNMILGWMTGVTGAPQPISHIGLEVRNGVLQVMYYLKNCSVGLYACPNISDYTRLGGAYYMSASSPAGVVTFPRQQWVHLSVSYEMSPTNGQVKVWQDGTLIMDLMAPTMDTFNGTLGTNTAGDMLLQFGIYAGATTGTQRIYADDFKVTDFRPMP